MNLSPNFSLDEATFSPTAKRLGITNQPSKAILANMVYAAQHLEVVRNVILKTPLDVSSWYRAPKLNRALKGAIGGHPTGFCIDLTPRGLSIDHAFDLIVEYNHTHDDFFVDQLINEYDRWLHISFDHNRKRNQHFKKE